MTDGNVVSIKGGKVLQYETPEVPVVRKSLAEGFSFDELLDGLRGVPTTVIMMAMADDGSFSFERNSLFPGSHEAIVLCDIVRARLLAQRLGLMT